jgi:hypothetical protein
MIDVPDMIPMIDPQAVNIQPAKFIGFLNLLARKSKYGIRPFSTVTTQGTGGLFYDEKNQIAIDNYDTASYPLVADYLIHEYHNDVISTWTDVWAEYGLRVVVTVDRNGAFVNVTSEDDRNFSIVVHDGVWYDNSSY